MSALEVDRLRREQGLVIAPSAGTWYLKPARPEWARPRLRAHSGDLSLTHRAAKRSSGRN